MRRTRYYAQAIADYRNYRQCPVSGLPIHLEPEWTFTTADDYYRGYITRVGERILIYKSVGTPRKEDASATSDHVRAYLEQRLPEIGNFVALFDYSELVAPPIANRLEVLRQLRRLSPSIERIGFFGMTGSLLPMVNLALRISGLSEKMYMCRTYEEAMLQAVAAVQPAERPANRPAERPAGESSPTTGAIAGFGVSEIDAAPGSANPVIDATPGTAIPGRTQLDALLSVLGKLIWEQDYAVAVPRLGEHEPLRDVFQAVEVLRDDLQQLAAENRQRRQDLEQALKEKERFIADVSHEIRTPLTGILGAVRSLKSPDNRINQTEALGILTTSAQLLLDAVDEVLTVSEIEHDRLQIRNEPFSPAEGVHTVAQIAKLRAAEKDLDLSLTVETSVPELVCGDGLRFRQIASNLLTNAVKFTTTGSISVHLSYEQVPNHERLSPDDREEGGDALLFQSERMLLLTVADTGVGMTPDQKAQVFQRFYRASDGRRVAPSGSGIGLSLVSELVDRIGGTITVSSSPERGSTFAVRLPAPVCTNRIRFVPPGPRALLADDNSTNRSILSEQLKQHGCRVTTVASGREALAALDAMPWDVVILDSNMPEMNGIETARRIRNFPDGRGDTVLIAWTASGGAEHSERLLEAGMDAVLVKPANETTLLQALKHIDYPVVEGGPEATRQTREVDGAPSGERPDEAAASVERLNS